MNTNELITFKKYFNLEIPEGILFYPHCGRNTYEAIILFIDSVHEFHFADSNRIELPTLECGILKSDSIINTQKPVRGDDLGKGFIPLEIVQSAVYSTAKYCTYDLAPQFKKYLNIDMGRIIMKDNIKKQNWKLSLQENDEIKLYCHSLDGSLVLLKLDNISVFYHKSLARSKKRGNEDNISKELLEIVIEKMLDGGIILTEIGEIGDRRVKYIGKCGRQSKPTHAWQINK